MNEFAGFLEHFSILPDPRIDRTRKHNLTDILFIAVCTVICRGEGFTDMEDFATDREDWLSKYVELPGGIPSHDIFRRVFSVIDPDAFQACFMRWSESMHEATGGEVIALDGKTVRHSFDTASGQPALHMISAWASENGLSLGHVKVDKKSNEITVLPKPLEMLSIKGRTITMDAIGCQKDLARQIVDKGADYVLCVKGNQVSLHEDVKWFFAECDDLRDVEHTYYEGVEKDHGRIEVRKCWAVESEAKWLGFGGEWAGLRSIAVLRAERIVAGKKSVETRYYITSLPGDAKKTALAAREHWAVENSLHWVLDVTVNEDMSRVRKDNAPENLATLRRSAINMVRKDNMPMKGRPSIRRAMKRAGYLNANLERILVS